MPIAIISDMHGNLIALEAVLADLDRADLLYLQTFQPVAVDAVLQAALASGMPHAEMVGKRLELVDKKNYRQ